MFYKKGIDITNDKQMFNFLKEHFTYHTANSWNLGESIANNVKLYNLGLSGDWTTALSFLESDDYHSINNMLLLWEDIHPGYTVGFNGRSGGYLVLYNKNNRMTVLPGDIDNCEDYEEYKRYCREFYGSVKANHSDLRFYTQLVQSFDKLCDQLREYCDGLSNLSYENLQMERTVEMFNEQYHDDLEYLGFEYLECYDGVVDIEEISSLDCLREAFLKLADRRDVGYSLQFDKYNVSYKKSF